MEGKQIINALIIGATSSLAYAIAHCLAKQEANLVLAGRDNEELERLEADIRIRYGVTAVSLLFDLDHIEHAASFMREAEKKLGQVIDAVFIITGDMTGEKRRDEDEAIDQMIARNFAAPAKMMTAAALYMEEKGQGHVVVISSVAGDRGRQSNYLYGSSKAGLTAFASGLRNRFFKSGVHIMTVKPGFIDTPMTYGMHSPLIASREKVAALIIKATEKSKDSIYVPGIWRIIMMIICHIPEKVFKRLSL